MDAGSFGDLGKGERVRAALDEQFDRRVDRPLERYPASLLLGGTGIGLLGPSRSSIRPRHSVRQCGSVISTQIALPTRTPPQQRAPADLDQRAARLAPRPSRFRTFILIIPALALFPITR